MRRSGGRAPPVAEKAVAAGPVVRVVRCRTGFSLSEIKTG
jgi:hypothetical protein